MIDLSEKVKGIREGAALSLKNFEKIALYIEAHQRPVGD